MALTHKLMGISFTLDGRFPYLLGIPNICQASRPSIQLVRNLKHYQLDSIYKVTYTLFSLILWDIIFKWFSFSIVTAQTQPQPQLFLKSGEIRQSPKQRSARLGFHSQERYRDIFFLGLKFETETETQILESRDREFDETFFLTFSRPRLNFSYFRDRDLDESQNRDFSRPRLFHYDF